MALFSTVVLCLSGLVGGASFTLSSDQPEPTCHDWGEAGQGAELVLEGESGWLSCPLFSHPMVYNYSSAHRAGLNLFWYRVPVGQDLEQPIRYSQRLSKDRERLWLQPATAEDTGQYICMLRNRTSCTKISVTLEVVSPKPQGCEPPVATAPRQVAAPLQEDTTLVCPDLEDVAKMADSHPSVTWYHRCFVFPFWDPDRVVQAGSLHINIMSIQYQGLYYCQVQYSKKNRTGAFTRALNVTGVSPSILPKFPSILHPNKDQVYSVRRDMEVRLQCQALFPYLDGAWELWWSIDGKRVGQLQNPRFSSISSPVKSYFGDRTEQSVLLIQDFQRHDLDTEFNCSARNQLGFATHRATLQEEVYLPSVELGCGLGVTLVLMLLLFVVYHVFWLELLLLYRSWFGTDERHTDDKEFDVYISYARNSEEENFAVTTLRKVLENELGYSVCIFDRDSLPGGTITDETLSFVGRSRRLLVVLSPGYAARGSQALLELKAGIDSMALGGHLRVILVQYKPVQRRGWVRELRSAHVVLALVRWQGERSSALSSTFWKRLRLQLPVQQLVKVGKDGG